MTSKAAPQSLRVSVADLQAFCVSALTQVGISKPDAHTTAEILVTTDAFGVFTHGVKCLRGYIRRIQAGGIRRDCAPEIASEGPGWAIVDGNSALGMVTSSFAMGVAIQKALATGISYVGVRNSCHFGAAGLYALQAARAGMIGLTMSNDTPSVTAPGSCGPVLGSNPFAYAIPAGRNPPVFLDIATSAVAGGKVLNALSLGQSVPLGWLVDQDGQPTTDPRGFGSSKALVPMAGHKGYGLALLIENLSAIVPGAAVTRQVASWTRSDPSLPTGHGACFIALNIGAMMPLDQFKQRVDQTIEEIHAAAQTKGTKRIWVPGEMEWEHRAKALQEGVLLPPEVMLEFGTIADELSLPLPGVAC